MKTIAMKTKMNASRVFLLTFCLLMMSSLKVAAATKYGFWVGGVEVTSDNYTNITSSAITSGTVKYVPSTKTLTLTNCTIKRTGNYERAIENNSCEGLIVKFVGTNNLSSVKASAVRFETKGTLEVVSGTTTLSSENYEGIYLYNECKLSIKGPGKLIVKSTNDCAIEGGMVNGVWCSVSFSDGLTATIQGKKGDIVDVMSDFDENSNVEVRFKATGNSSYPNIRNVNIFELYTAYHYVNGSAVIVEPLDAKVEVVNEDYSVESVYLDGVEIYNQDIVVSTRYKVLFTKLTFPDENLRSFMTNKYNRTYMTEKELFDLTTLDVHNQGIKSLEGIERLVALETLDCSYNNIEGITIRNTNLTNLNCSNCQLIFLSCQNAALTTLNCENNHFTKNEWPSLDVKWTSLKTLRCGGNDYEEFKLGEGANLTSLDCSNNTKLTSLDCSNQSLTSLNISGCSQLTTLNCSKNKLGSLSVSGKTNLQTLNCSGNASLTSLNCMNDSKLSTLDCSSCALTSLNLSGCSNLSSLKCQSNQFTTLTVKNFKNLKTLDCGSNVKLKTLDCSNNALTGLYVTDNSVLGDLDCSNNSLTYLSVANDSKLKTLVCSNNKLTSITITGCSNFGLIQCDGNQFTSLSFRNMTSLYELKCSNNPKLTSLMCYNNPLLGELGVDNCTALQTLECYSNNLSSLDVSTCTALQTLKCHSNRITGILLPEENSNLQSVSCYSNCISNMEGIVNRLPDRNGSTSGELKAIYPSLSSEQNAITQSQVQTALNNNWKTYQYVNGSWIVYEGSSNGIVTGIEPAVSSAAEDATPLYNLSGQRVDKSYTGVVIRNNKKVRMK